MSGEVDPLPRLAPVLRAAAARFGTPVHVTDAPTLEVSAERVRAAFPDPLLRAYSVKANDVAGVVARVAGLGFDANVVSRGEWAVARRAGLQNDRITLEGIGKSDADLAAACRAAADGAPLRWLAIESLDEAEALVRIAARALRNSSARVDVLFRLNPEVVPETIRELAVGAGTSKFGMTADELSAAVEIVGGSSGLVPRGIHLHVGSQLRAVDAWRDAIRRGLALVALLGGTRPAFDTLDIGGGFPIVPLGEAAPDPLRFARELPALLDAIPSNRRPSRLAIEPGRALVARAGFLVARVLHVRERHGRHVVLDTGMTELIRPALYEAWHEIAALTSLGRPVDPVLPVDRRGRGDRGGAGARDSAGARGGAEARAGAGAPGAAGDPTTALEPARVDGPICESTDHLGEHRLPPLRRGDLVVIRDAGAYAASLASTYNGRRRPPQVIAESDGSLTLARRRGSLAALG